MAAPKKPMTNAEILRAAQLFYNEDQSRKCISAEMKIDTRRVTALLKEAKAREIVKIHIFESPVATLAQRIQAKFPHIEKLMIAPGGPVNTPVKHAALYQQWALMAAVYFDEVYAAHPHDKPLHVGLTGGEHVLEFVNTVPEKERENLHIHVTALIGRGHLSETTIHNDPVINAGILWSHCGRFAGRFEYATVSSYEVKEPGRAALKAVREEIAKVERNRHVVEILKAMDAIDIAFVGIGSVNVSRMNPVTRNRVTMTGLLENIVTAEQLAREGAVGALSYSLFDKNGKSQNKWNFFLTAGHGTPYAGVDFYKQMVATGKKVIAFGGPYQEDAIRLALKAKMFNVWITDEHTARQIAEGD
jgi:DNA-binding transcriptional regulator LsrR (DeoR family)